MIGTASGSLWASSKQPGAKQMFSPGLRLRSLERSRGVRFRGPWPRSGIDPERSQGLSGSLDCCGIGALQIYKPIAQIRPFIYWL